jgi:hypothetical protein
MRCCGSLHWVKALQAKVFAAKDHIQIVADVVAFAAALIQFVF